MSEDRWEKPTAECRERRWFAICAGNGTGWRPCPEKTPGATEDLNRLSYFQQAGHDGYYQSAHFNEWIGSPIAAPTLAALEDFATRGAAALPTVRHCLPRYAAAVERAALDNDVRVEDVTPRMLAGAEIAIWREENPPDVVTICQKCHVLPVTMQCPEAPHDRCHACWRIWFNGGVIQGRKRHPGRWSDRTRAKRARRLYKARMRRERRK